MKAKIKIDTRVVKEHGCVHAVVLGIINTAVESLSTKDVAQMVGISFPTAQKVLKELVDASLIKVSGDYDKRYIKN